MFLVKRSCCGSKCLCHSLLKYWPHSCATFRCCRLSIRAQQSGHSLILSHTTLSFWELFVDCYALPGGKFSTNIWIVLLRCLGGMPNQAKRALVLVFMTVLVMIPHKTCRNSLVSIGTNLWMLSCCQDLSYPKTFFPHPLKFPSSSFLILSSPHLLLSSSLSFTFFLQLMEKERRRTVHHHIRLLVLYEHSLLHQNWGWYTHTVPIASGGVNVFSQSQNV